MKSPQGLEGMPIAPGGRALYPMLEGALTTDSDQRRLIINEFDVHELIIIRVDALLAAHEQAAAHRSGSVSR